jgi:hypothetical protein
MPEQMMTPDKDLVAESCPGKLPDENLVDEHEKH